MSVRFDASTEGLTRTASLPTGDGPFTLMAWFYRAADYNADEALWRFGEATGSNMYQPYIQGTDDVLYLRLGATGNVTGGSPLTWAIGAWHHIAMARPTGVANPMLLYVDGVQYISGVPANMASTDLLQVGNDTEYTQPFNGRVAAFKCWATDLTPTQIAAEMLTYAPIVTGSLNSWCPLQVHTDLTDHSVNGYHFASIGGTLTTEADPPGVNGVIVNDAKVVIRKA